MAGIGIKPFKPRPLEGSKRTIGVPKIRTKKPMRFDIPKPKLKIP